MTWPTSVVTRAITFPGSQILETGGDLHVEVVTRASRSLLSRQAGFRLEKLVSRVAGAQPGGSVTVLLPVTDRPGDWADADTGQPISVGPDLHSHLYLSTVTVYSGSTAISERVIGPYPLPTGATPVDSSTMVIPTGTAQGHLVTIPQSWLDIIAAAQAIVDGGPVDPTPDPEPAPRAPFAVVQVITGDEPRPDAEVVAWIGGTTEPAPMGIDDLWWREVVPVVPDPDPEPEPVAPPVITTTTIAPMTAGAPYSQALAASGPTPITWGVSAGALPAGVGINSSTGALNGTPVAAGDYSFTVSAANAGGSDTQVFTVTVSPAPATDSFSVFNWTTSPYAITRAADAQPNIEIATGFYGVDVAGDLLTKVRLYIPEGPLPASIPVRAYHPPVEGSPTLGTGIVATGTITNPVIGWNEATLDTPVVMENGRMVWVSYDAGGGVYYAAGNAIPDGAFGTHVFLADYFPYGTDSSARRSHWRIGTNPTSSNEGTWYGLDVVVEAPQ